MTLMPILRMNYRIWFYQAISSPLQTVQQRSRCLQVPGTELSIRLITATARLLSFILMEQLSQHPILQDRRVHKVLQDLLVQMALRDHQVHKEFRALREMMALLEPRDHKVQLAHRDLQGLPVFKDLRGMMVLE